VGNQREFWPHRAGHGPAEAHIAKVLPKPLPPVGPITSNPRGHDARSRLTGRPRFARKGWQQRASHCCIQFNSVSSDLSRATSRTLGSSEAGCRWYARFCDRGVIERKSHERGPRGKDRYGTITNPNPASRGARGLAPIPVHRLKASLRRGIFPTNHSDWVSWMTHACGRTHSYLARMALKAAPRREVLSARSS